jgi:SAM-dependent methyltransferase
MPSFKTLRSWPAKVARLKSHLSAAFGPANLPHFHLESPGAACGGVTSPLIVSGWVIPPVGREVRGIEVRVDGKPAARTSARGHRPDVARVFPVRAGAIRSGFSTEVVLDHWVGRTAELALVADFGGDPFVLAQIPLKVERRVGEGPLRERTFQLADLLACPDCKAGGLRREPDQVRCGACGATYETRRGTPLFIPSNDLATSRLLEAGFTHPYSEDAQGLIDQYADGVVLDFGSGHPHPDRRHPNVLLHEAVQYDATDVVSFTPRLPYRDDCFDAIISQAVFEHIPRPWEVASELHRVLKPGGQIHIDTAFMQPFHSDPNHFFNMTISGAREIFRPFREVRAGVKSYQLPSFGLRMQLGVMLEHLASGPWRDRMQAMLGELERDGSTLDAALDPDGQRFLAAGVFFHGIK